jgi:hypothetical protein
MMWLIGLGLVYLLICLAIPDPPANIGVSGDTRSPIDGELPPAELTETLRGVADGK